VNEENERKRFGVVGLSGSRKDVGRSFRSRGRIAQKRSVTDCTQFDSSGYETVDIG